MEAKCVLRCGRDSPGFFVDQRNVSLYPLWTSRSRSNCVRAQPSSLRRMRRKLIVRAKSRQIRMPARNGVTRRSTDGSISVVQPRTARRPTATLFTRSRSIGAGQDGQADILPVLPRSAGTARTRNSHPCVAGGKTHCLIMGYSIAGNVHGGVSVTCCNSGGYATQCRCLGTPAESAPAMMFCLDFSSFRSVNVVDFYGR